MNDSLKDHCSVDLTTAIGRLLSDAGLRTVFRGSPNVAAEMINLDTKDVAMFIQLDISQIEDQAATLLNKRWNEVRSLIPKTVQDLGEEAHDLFMFYANQNWPEGHRRHPLDAFQFLQFLIGNKIHRPSGMELKRVRWMKSL
jgi:glucan biosynthesis protein